MKTSKTQLLKKLLLVFFANIALLLFYAQKSSVLAADCNFSISPGNVVKDNTIVVQSSEIIKTRKYSIGIQNRGEWINLPAEASNSDDVFYQTYKISGNSLLTKGNHNVVLQYENNNDICSGKITVNYPSGCSWSISPQNPIINESLSLSLTGVSRSYPELLNLTSKVNTTLLLEKPNGDKKTQMVNTNTFSFTPNTIGTYRLFFMVSDIDVSPKSEEICSVAFDVGTANKPGNGINRKKLTGEEEKAATSLCKDNNDCKNCLEPAGNSTKGIWTALGCIPTSDPQEFITWIGKYIIFIASGIGFLLMISGAVQVLTSSGDPEKLKSGTGLITSALGGLLFVALSIFLLKVIGVDILQIPGF